MGYHRTKIPKGKFGSFSKIEEEFFELKDADEQNNPVMVLCEMSDLLGAIEAYAKRWNVSLIDLMVMKDATASAFKDGTRTPSEG